VCKSAPGVNGKCPAKGRKIEPGMERNADFYLDQNGSIRYILPSFSRRKKLNLLDAEERGRYEIY
jgi:hypothetical protein